MIGRIIVILGIALLPTFGFILGKKSVTDVVTPHIDRYLLMDSINDAMTKMRISHQDMVFDQILIDTDSLRSEVFIKNHNMFKIRYTGGRCSTSKGVRMGYSYYANWRESLIDYALQQEAYYRGLDDSTYYAKLQMNHINQ